MLRRLLLHAALLLLIALATRPSEAEAMAVRLTYYLPTGNPTASGVYPYSGVAACSWNFPLGTVLAFPDGREVVCMDRGMLGSTGHVDLFVWSMAEGQAAMATYGAWPNVSVVAWGSG